MVSCVSEKIPFEFKAVCEAGMCPDACPGTMVTGWVHVDMGRYVLVHIDVGGL